jgi:hypothetical protein
MTIYQKTQALVSSLSLLLLSAISAHAADATFSWTANTDPVAGYKIHYGTSSRNYNSVVDVGLPAAVNGGIVASVEGLQEGITYYFAATAYNSAAEESAFSDEVVYAVPGAAIPEPPVAADMSLQGTEDTPLSGQLDATSSGDTALEYTIVSQPGHGTLTVEDATGSFTYTPLPNYSGSDTFSYKVGNSGGFSNPATAAITLAPVNDPPEATSSAFSVAGDGSYSGTLSADDIDGDALTYYLTVQGAKGTATVNQNGSFTYTPNQDQSGSDFFAFGASDGTSPSNSGTVTVSITPVAESGAGSDTGSETVTDTTGTNDGTEATSDTDAASETVDTENNVTNDFALEVGELLVTSEWQHVAFSTEFISPSVVAKSTTTNNPEPGFVSIRNLTSQGFEIRISEWDYADGQHPEEIVSFMAMERGRHQIADNIYGVAQCTTVSGLNSFQPISFSPALPSQPVVIASIVTNNDPNATILRMKDITSQGFSIAMQEQENSDGNHGEESFCFIAMEKWSGVIEDLMVEVGATVNGLTSTAATMSFEQPFPTIPFVLADMQSTNGSDTAILGMSNLSATDITMTIVEEQSADSEIGHTSEIGGYFAFAPVNPSEKSVIDEPAIEEELTPDTQPDSAETDQDTTIVTDEPEGKPKKINSKTLPSVSALYNDLLKERGNSKK